MLNLLKITDAEGSMKVKLAFIFIIVLAVPIAVFAGGSSSTCATKYPVVLAHGMGAQAKILGFIDYWGDIPGALSDEGARVYVTSVNAMDATSSKGASFRQQILEILAITGAAKVNIIGHSHGTIY